MAAPWRVFWLLVLAWHVVAASAWWWLMPGGFPPTHPRFWANRVVPIAVLVSVVTAVWAARRSHWNLLRRVLVIFPAAWGAGAITARLIFPVSFRWLFLPPLLGAVLMAAAAFLALRRHAPVQRWPMLLIAKVAAVVGAFFPLTQRAPAPATRPVNVVMPEVVRGPGRSESTFRGLSDSRLRVHPGDGSLTVRLGSLSMSVQPLLRFESRSPDGCWTLLAPNRMRSGPELALSSAFWDESGLAFRYHSDYDAVLRVVHGRDDGPIHLEAYARLPRAVYSHLNSFCDLRVSGHRRLSIAFSPCPDSLIDVRPADYPVGRPLRLAYLDPGGVFHVAEATSGEKGPFRELAQGRLTRSEPLAITLYDHGKAQLRIVLDDWPAQAGTDLSPTAGWGLPVNAIEFVLDGERPGSAADIYITLAGTSVGRGWDSVGHRAGVYRNRMRIEEISRSTRSEATRDTAGSPRN